MIELTLDLIANTPTDLLVIVGGGTSGLVTAAMFQDFWKQKANISVIYDPNNKTIGVGEGTTPTVFDVGGGHDILTWTNAGKGSRLDLLALAGGAAEIWLANVIATDSVIPTIA